ncbi:autotransporter assembly complex protein TamA [Xanthomonadaceae bacterium JHOS43]|nr:autotransporter assembly complex protein TamA [Xanthomonadaceae bacterium JHOS43]
MPRLRQIAVLLSLLLPALVEAQGLGSVQIRGIEGDALENVRKSVSLLQLTDVERRGLSEARLSYLLRNVSDEVERALQPYGYYQATVETQVLRHNQVPDVVLSIDPGTPVTVRDLTIAIEGAAQADAAIADVVAGFRPRKEDVLDHRLYEAGKLSIQRALLARGYFDAEMEVHRVEVSRRLGEASIDLGWNSGARYRFGETRFEGSHIHESLLHKSVPYARGEPYEQDDLLKLHQRLTDLDYFGYIDVRPDTEQAEGDDVPIAISLTPGKRTVYTAGFSFGTDSGAGVQLGLERRWVNERGHKLAAHLDWAQRRKSLGTEYRIPAFAWAEGWYAFGANRRDEESDVLKTRITELVASRSGMYRGWNLGVAMHARLEDFEIGDAPARRDGTAQRGESRLIYPALSAQRVVSDDPMYPSRGFSLRGELKAGASALGSDTSFGQFLLDAKLIRSMGEKNRLLFRGQLGRTFTTEFDELPPSLRFFAGGDRSIRGYGYQEVGPRVSGIPTGGRNLLVGSAEYERMFSQNWGAAVFVDAGNAFNEINEGASLGAGVGLRWRSPVGMVRVDVAHGFDARETFQLHINIGPDL